jgi:site-specific DNA-methyltransferase (adenine-specific)
MSSDNMNETYRFLSPLTDEEFAALKADIARRGVQVPVEKDEAGNVLDGFHRVRACQELGIKDYPTIIRIGMTHEEKVEHALLCICADTRFSNVATHSEQSGELSVF